VQCTCVAVQRIVDNGRTVGLLYVILAAFLLCISFFRRKRSNHDFADVHREPLLVSTGSRNQPQAAQARIWGRPFRTSGTEVIVLTATVLALEVALFVLIVKL
jgi:hypothetical protein